jgi:histidinol-phosphate aminotransferase
VETIVSEAPGLVIIDEAYVEFGGESFVSLVSGGRVLVTRTMSKAFGLAGLRIGYGIGSPAIVAAVEKSRGPYKVSAVAEAAATAVLAEDCDWVTARITDVQVNRARFIGGLEAIGYAPIVSSANFVLVPVRDYQVELQGLRNAGIAVRALPGLTGIGDALRIAIGPWDMMQQCLDALRTAG